MLILWIKPFHIMLFPPMGLLQKIDSDAPLGGIPVTSLRTGTLKRSDGPPCDCRVHSLLSTTTTHLHLLLFCQFICYIKFCEK